MGRPARAPRRSPHITAHNLFFRVLLVFSLAACAAAARPHAAAERLAPRGGAYSDSLPATAARAHLEKRSQTRSLARGLLRGHAT
jgi:hypothetical protein